MFFVLLASISVLAFNIQPAKAQGTIYIRADGSVDPSAAPIQRDVDIYSLLSDIYDNIVIERSNIVLDGNGYTLWGQGLGGPYGVLLTNINNVTISNMSIVNTGYAIYLVSSSNNTVSNNNLFHNDVGVYPQYASNGNFIYENSITDNYYGICIENSSLNVVIDNNITGWYVDISEGLIVLQDSSSNTICGNLIASGLSTGVLLGYSSNDNVVYENTIRDNGQCGIALTYGPVANNSFFHNNIINNSWWQAYTAGSINAWDDGYPSGGNYWSDYVGGDLFRGPFQNETGSDGIGDKSRVFDINNVDHYPLMKPYPWMSHDLGITQIPSSKTVIGQNYTATLGSIIFNYGSYSETFSFSLRTDSTDLISETLTADSRSFASVTFKWNTSGFAFGNYTLVALAETVPGETEVSDNSLTEDVHIGVPSDISSSTPGVYDKKCDMKDVAYLVILFNTKPTSPNWNPNADVDNNGVVSMIDIAIAILNFNEHE